MFLVILSFLALLVSGPCAAPRNSLDVFECLSTCIQIPCEIKTFNSKIIILILRFIISSADKSISNHFTIYIIQTFFPIALNLTYLRIVIIIFLLFSLWRICKQLHSSISAVISEFTLFFFISSFDQSIQSYFSFVVTFDLITFLFMSSLDANLLLKNFPIIGATFRLLLIIALYISLDLVVTSYNLIILIDTITDLKFIQLTLYNLKYLSSA